MFFIGTDGYYGWELRQQFDGVEAEPVEGFTPALLERLRHPAPPLATYRTYHPKRLRTQQQWYVVDALPGLIREALTAEG